MSFDNQYYLEKKQKLQVKAQQLQQEYLNNAFKFTGEINDILAELKQIEAWEKENIKEVKTPKK